LQMARQRLLDRSVQVRKQGVRLCIALLQVGSVRLIHRLSSNRFRVVV
jgi:hypothetical protein